MLLSFKSSYLSIDSFDPLELPNFVVLTGENGAGKSQFLEAISKGHVAVDPRPSSVVLFNADTFKLSPEVRTNVEDLREEREEAWHFFESSVLPNARRWRLDLGESYEKIREECLKHGKALLDVQDHSIEKYRSAVRKFFLEEEQVQGSLAQSIYFLSTLLPHSLDEVTKDEFTRLIRSYSVRQGLFVDQLGKLFWDYYTRSRLNQLDRFENEQGGASFSYLSDAEFRRMHGEKPWDVFNRILNAFGALKYQVSNPEGLGLFDRFQLKIFRSDKPHLKLDFSSLSTGERTILALVGSVYRCALDSNFFPDLLLLDEVDAYLHPTLVKKLLSVLSENFLSNGVRVIIVTHSPTTIALAPEESLFVMNVSGEARIEKRPRQQALHLLTDGFATLEQGLTLFDQVANSGLTIISEGFNTNFISRALANSGLREVTVLGGVEKISGKNQLRTLFDFFSKVKHDGSVLFVWDSDAGQSFEFPSGNNTFAFVFERNSRNRFAAKGIENLFDEQLLADFVSVTKRSDGTILRAFDGARKRDFEEFVLSRQEPSDFSNFQPLIDRVRALVSYA